MAAPKKGGLGRGLDALFADVPVKAPKETEVIKNREEDVYKRQVAGRGCHRPDKSKIRKDF